MDPKLKPKFYPFIQENKHVLECDCVTGVYSMLIKVAFPNTQELDQFIGQLQQFGQTSTQIVFSTSVENRNISIE
jgi:Lrp/AsnC family leucine-responsive transcriptional regulator